MFRETPGVCMYPLRRNFLLSLALSGFCTVVTPHQSLLGQPAFFQPGADYYNAKGFSVRVKWELPQRVVQEGHDLAATLVVTGATNPAEVVKPDLAELPDFARHFIVTRLPDSPPSNKEVRFDYALRPRNRTVTQVPALVFKFQSLAAPPGKNPFRSARAESVPITVTEPPAPPPVPLTEDDHHFHLVGDMRNLSASFVPRSWAWAAAALFGPLVAFVWFMAWQRLFPDAARLARLHRSRAARRADREIRHAGRTPDPPAAIATALLHYLRARFPLPLSAVTPGELTAALTVCNVPSEVAEQTADVIRECDRARFAPPGDRGVSLAELTQGALTRLEEIA